MSLKLYIYLIIIVLLTIYPASAAGVTLNRWVLNVKILENGTVEEIIQTEIENIGPSSLDGFIFNVPAPSVSTPVILPFFPSGEVAELKTAQGVTEITVKFNKPVEAGKKWNGRIEINVENWVLRSGQDYSINVPVEAPKAIVSGKKTEMSIAGDPEIRSQVSLPKAVAPASVEPSIDPASKKPSYKKLLQFGNIVLTWFKLNIGDVIKVKGSYSDDLSKILGTDEKIKALSDRIKNEKAQGNDVAEAENHLTNARDYSNGALESFWKNEEVAASLDAANNEMSLAENSLLVRPLPAETKKNPGFEAPAMVLMLLITLIVKSRNA